MALCIESFIFLCIFGEAKIGEKKEDVEMRVGKNIKGYIVLK